MREGCQHGLVLSLSLFLSLCLEKRGLISCCVVFQDVSAMTEEEQLALALQMSMSGAMEGAMETELATDQVTLLVQSEAHS